MAVRGALATTRPGEPAAPSPEHRTISDRLRTKSLCLWVWLLGALTPASLAAQPHQPLTWSINLATNHFWPKVPRIAVDADDDDEDGSPDAEQTDQIPMEDLASLRLLSDKPEESVHIRVSEGLRLVRGQRALPSEVEVAPTETWPQVQGVRASSRRGGDAVIVSTNDRQLVLPVTVVELRFLDAENELLDGSQPLRLSLQVTHDRTLPREAGSSDRSPDPANFRISLRDASLRARNAELSLESLDAEDRRMHHMLRHVPANATGHGTPHLTPFLRLVADRTDLSAPEVGDRLLSVQLRDRVRVRYQVGRTELYQDLRVGAPGPRGGPQAALRGRLRLRALRLQPGGVPVIGHSDLEAIGLLREQVLVANEIWLQCGIDFGDPARADAAVVDPPPPALLAVGDGDGLPAKGGGWIRLRVGKRKLPPVETRPGATPAETAFAVGRAVREAGFVPEITVNPRTEYGAGRSADVIVRTRAGQPVTLSPWTDQPICTDAMQHAEIGRVDLTDGIQQFNNMTAAAGSLEERTLLKLVADQDPTTVDILVINQFASPERQGEAFIEGQGGAIINALILDRNGIRFQRQAWVQSHELGHVLLNAPYHPDNVGPDRPWLLMDADARQGRVTGPKRLTEEECARARRQSGPGSSPLLLTPLD